MTQKRSSIDDKLMNACKPWFFKIIPSYLLITLSLACGIHSKPSKEQMGRMYFNAKFSFDSEISENPPLLKIDLNNQSTSSLELFYLNTPHCFVQNYLHIEFEQSPMPLPKYRECKASDNKAIKSKINRNSKSIEFSFSDIFEPNVKWIDGIYRIRIKWINDPLPSSYYIPRSAWIIAQPLQTFDLKKGESIELIDGSVFKFLEHNHKRTHQNEKSPLMVYGEFKSPSDSEFKDVQLNLNLPEEQLFELAENFYAKLISHTYDTSMKIQYYGQMLK